MAVITLKSKDKVKPIAIVDDADYEWLNDYVWTFGSGYVVTRIKQPDGSSKLIQMHRLIMDAPADSVVDHINRKKFDNRRSNLRLATIEQNNHNRAGGGTTWNSSDYIGVSRRYGEGKWKATILTTCLGNFEEEDEAAYVRDQAAMQLYGEYAYTNFNYEDSVEVPKQT